MTTVPWALVVQVEGKVAPGVVAPPGRVIRTLWGDALVSGPLLTTRTLTVVVPPGEVGGAVTLTTE